MQVFGMLMLKEKNVNNEPIVLTWQSLKRRRSSNCSTVPQAQKEE
jgi:hypothetical protein